MIPIHSETDAFLFPPGVGIVIWQNAAGRDKENSKAAIILFFMFFEVVLSADQTACHDQIVFLTMKQLWPIGNCSISDSEGPFLGWAHVLARPYCQGKAPGGRRSNLSLLEGCSTASLLRKSANKSTGKKTMAKEILAGVNDLLFFKDYFLSCSAKFAISSLLNFTNSITLAFRFR